jgi:hypothetical protein
VGGRISSRPKDAGSKSHHKLKRTTATDTHAVTASQALPREVTLISSTNKFAKNPVCEAMILQPTGGANVLSQSLNIYYFIFILPLTIYLIFKN